MFDPEEVKQLRLTANELNNLLQVILEAANYLEKIVGNNAEAQIYLKMMRISIDRSAKVANGLREAAENFKCLPPLHAPAAEEKMDLDRPALKSATTGINPQIPIINPDGAGDLILLVEDEVHVQLMMQNALTDQGYRIVSARNGLEAIRIYKALREKISLVILDYVMPIMDGAEVFEELRLINPQVAVVLTSGFTELESLKTMLAKGLRGFIPKPFTRDKLLMQVNTTLNAIRKPAAASGTE
jgi:CheY-like chemotaxis protein